MTKLALADVAAQVLQEHSLAEVVLVAERVVDTGEQQFTVGGWHQTQGGTGGAISWCHPPSVNSSSL